MTDEIKLTRAAERATQAQRLLSDPLLAEGFAKLESDLMAAWKASDPRDAQGREIAWNVVQQVGRLKGYLETVMSGGKIALVDLADRKKRLGIF